MTLSPLKRLPHKQTEVYLPLNRGAKGNMRGTEGLNQERRMGIEEGGKKAQKDKATPKIVMPHMDFCLKLPVRRFK